MKYIITLKNKFTFTHADAIVYIFFTPLLLIYHLFESAKQIFYFIPFFATAYIFAIKLLKYNETTLKINKSPILVILLYVFFCFFSIFILPSGTEIYWSNVFRDTVITVGALLLFSIEGLKFKHSHIVWLLILSCICYIIAIEFDINWNFMSSILYSNYDFRHEYHFGSIACIFVLYFIYKKDYKFLLLAILLMLLVNKRANLMGIIPACITFWFCFVIFDITKHKLLLIGLIVLYYIVFYLLAINIESCTVFFLQSIGKSYIDADTFLTGRLIMQRDLVLQIYERGFVNYLFGNGVGQTEFFLWKTIYNEVYYFYEKPFLAHNDFMKLHFDIGLFGVVVYFFVMYYLYCVSSLGCFMYFGILPLFLIDNTIIFLYNMLVACMVARVDEDSKPASIGKFFKFSWHDR